MVDLIVGVRPALAIKTSFLPRAEVAAAVDEVAVGCESIEKRPVMAVMVRRRAVGAVHLAGEVEVPADETVTSEVAEGRCEGVESRLHVGRQPAPAGPVLVSSSVNAHRNALPLLRQFEPGRNEVAIVISQLDLLERSIARVDRGAATTS